MGLAADAPTVRRVFSGPVAEPSPELFVPEVTLHNPQVLADAGAPSPLKVWWIVGIPQAEATGEAHERKTSGWQLSWKLVEPWAIYAVWNGRYLPGRVERHVNSLSRVVR
jgi:hypothetical protein